MTPKGAIELVIFDCDGVLIDTEPIANRVLKEQLDAIGLVMPFDEVMATFVGRSRDDCIEMAGRMLGRPLPGDFGARWDAAFDAALAHDVRPVDGIPELLRELRQPFCVASNGEPERMRLALRSAGLLAQVEGRLFTASEVPRPKPAPDLFLHAARTLGARPARTAVIEDTTTGVEAAVAAGMKVFAYAGASHADPAALLARGAIVFDSMHSLPAMLEHS